MSHDKRARSEIQIAVSTNTASLEHGHVVP